MTTRTNAGFAASDVVRYSSKILNQSVVTQPVARLCMDYGVINLDKTLLEQGGGTHTLNSAVRVDSQGLQGDVDFYSNAQFAQSDKRTIAISKVSHAFKFRKDGSQDQQYESFKLDEGQMEREGLWMAGIVGASLINQLASNNATSVTQPAVASNAFSGALLPNVTGNNTVAAPTYWYEGNEGGAITTATNITNSNKLSIKDFHIWAEVTSSNYAGRPSWQTLNGGVQALAFISRTGFTQLMYEATTVGQGAQFNEYVKAGMAGGKTYGNMQTFEIPGLPLLFVVVPDSWMPRGVSSGAETANTRRAFIVGANALDLCLGKGYGGVPSTGKEAQAVGMGSSASGVQGVNIEVDTNYKTLNKEGFGVVSLTYGAKKVQIDGNGSNTGTAYDLSTYVIDHYSAT